MGWYSVLNIQHDTIQDIDRDPAAWWKAVRQHMLPGDTGRVPGFSGGTEVVAVEHNDTMSVVVSGHGHSSKLGFLAGRVDHSDDEGRREVVRQLASSAGFTVQDRKGPTVHPILDARPAREVIHFEQEFPATVDKWRHKDHDGPTVTTILEALEAKGLSQSAFARVIGWRPGAVHKVLSHAYRKDHGYEQSSEHEIDQRCYLMDALEQLRRVDGDWVGWTLAADK